MAKQGKKVTAKKSVRPAKAARKNPPAKSRAKPAAAARKKAPVSPGKKAKPTPVKKTSGSAVRKVQAPKKKPAAESRRVRKPSASKAPAGKKTSPKKAMAAPVHAKPVKGLNAKQLAEFRKILLNLRDSIVDEISFLTGETLNHNQREAAGDLSNYGLHMADQGTDNFDREFALNLASNEQDVLYEIDEAILRIEQGTFGLCEQTGLPIEIERLRVLPYARLSRAAQEELERHTKRRRIPGNSSSMSYEEEEQPQEE